MTTLASLFVAIVAREHVAAHLLRPELQSEWDTLASVAESQTDVVLPRMESADLPISLLLSEQSPDPKFFGNVAMAEYFGLRSVRSAEP